MEPSQIVLALILVPFGIDLVSTILQRSRIGSPLHPELAGIFDEAEYAKSNRYTWDKSNFGLLKQIWDLFVFVGFWFLHGFSFVQEKCSSFGLDEPTTGLCFFGILTLGEQLLSQPWSIYSTFVLEEKHGFNNTTPQTYVKDLVKGIILMFLLGAPLLYALLWFFSTAGDYAWLYAYITITVFQVTLFFLAPVVLLPIFLEMIPLPEGSAVIVEGLDKAGARKFLNRIFYEVPEKDDKGLPVWSTKDNRFKGAKRGVVLCITGSSSGGWKIVEGPTEGGIPKEDAAVYASASGGQEPHLAANWDLPALQGDEGQTSQGTAQLLQEDKDKVTVKKAAVGALRSQLLALAQQLEYNCQNLFVIDGSTRSAHSNAFCTGFGRFRRICLFDTLLAQMSNNEITAVLGHEIGHDKLKHTIQGLVLALVLTLVQLYLLGRFISSPFLAEAFFLPHPTVYTGLLVFSVVWGVVENFLSIPIVVNSRANEHAADKFAVEADPDYATHLSEGLKKLVKNSKSNLTPHPFYAFLNYSHPPLLERLRAIEAYRVKKWS